MRPRAVSSWRSVGEVRPREVSSWRLVGEVRPRAVVHDDLELLLLIERGDRGPLDGGDGDLVDDVDADIDAVLQTKRGRGAVREDEDIDVVGADVDAVLKTKRGRGAVCGDDDVDGEEDRGERGRGDLNTNRGRGDVRAYNV